MTSERLRLLLPLWLLLAVAAAYGPAAVAGPCGAVAGLVVPMLCVFMIFRRVLEADVPFAVGGAVVLTITYWSLATLFTLWLGLSFSSTAELILIVLAGVLSAVPLTLPRSIADS